MTEVNSQITDAVTQTNVKVVAEAPAQAIASLYQVASSAAMCTAGEGGARRITSVLTTRLSG